MEESNNTIGIKNVLYNFCKESIKDRIRVSEANLARLRADLGSETKSSAGDKFETGRAMLQQEMKNNEEQLDSASTELNFLHQIVSKHAFKNSSEEIDVGSLVETKSHNYFICSGIGKVEVDGRRYYACSPHSPISLAMIGKKQGESFQINGKKFQIIAIY